MVTAIHVSKLFLAWATENGDLVTNLKLQKLLYYAQAWYLVNYQRRLFTEPIEAWKFGPVVRSAYFRWKKYSSTPIPYKCQGDEESAFQTRQLKFLTEFYRVFGGFSATELVSMTHNEDPWKEAYARGANSEITPVAMKAYYSKLYASHGKQA